MSPPGTTASFILQDLDGEKPDVVVDIVGSKVFDLTELGIPCKVQLNYKPQAPGTPSVLNLRVVSNGTAKKAQDGSEYVQGGTDLGGSVYDETTGAVTPLPAGATQIGPLTYGTTDWTKIIIRKP